MKGFHKIVTNCSIHSHSARFCHTFWETLINICQLVIPSQNTPFAQINRLIWGYNGHLCLRNTGSICRYMLFAWGIDSHKNHNDASLEIWNNSQRYCRKVGSWVMGTSSKCQKIKPKLLLRGSSNKTNGARPQSHLATQLCSEVTQKISVQIYPLSFIDCKG